MSLREKVSVKTKLNYSFGSLANNILNGFVFSNITFFYHEKLAMDSELLGIAWLIFGIWNTINDPIASHIIDNTRTKIGRRIPYIRYGSLFYGLAFIFCWFPIAKPGNQMGLFWNFLLVLFLLDTMFTIVGCCFYSLPNEIAFSGKERASLGLYGAVVNFINVIIGLVLPIILFTGVEGVHPYFGAIMIIMGVICGLLLYITSFGIKENLFAQMQPKEGFIEGIRTTFKNKPFWIMMVAAFLTTLIFPIFSSGILFYIDYVVTGQNLIPFIITFAIGIIIGLFTSQKMIKIFYSRKSSIINFSIIAIGFILLFFIGHNAYAATIPFLLIGIGFSGIMVALVVLTGDAIDNDELITGKRREAIYGGINAIITKPAISIANWLFLISIKGFGFVSPIVEDGVAIKQPQIDSTLRGIMFTFCLIPAIGLILSAISLKWFPLDGPDWFEKKEEIYKLHLKKEEEYLNEIQKKTFSD